MISGGGSSSILLRLNRWQVHKFTANRLIYLQAKPECGVNNYPFKPWQEINKVHFVGAALNSAHFELFCSELCFCHGLVELVLILFLPRGLFNALMSFCCFISQLKTRGSPKLL